MLITQLHSCASWQQLEAPPPPSTRPTRLCRRLLPPALSPLSNYKFQTQMRLINKYETSMRAGAALLSKWSGKWSWSWSRSRGSSRNSSRSSSGQYSCQWGRAAKITQEINIQVGQRERQRVRRHIPQKTKRTTRVSGEELSLNLNKLHTFDFGFRFGIGFFWG